MSGMDRLTVNAEDMKLHIISTANTTPLAINGDGFWIVKFLHDGTVEFNENLTPKEGSEEAWRLLQAESRRASQAAPTPSAGLREALDYVLQDDLHNRLTPRVVDIAYSAFMLGRAGKNKDDGGPCDWFNDTKPMVDEQIGKIRAALTASPAQEGGE